jgi:hypothetical protein
MHVTEVLNRQVLRTPLDGTDGRIGARKLAVLVVVLILVGAAGIFMVQRYILNIDTWQATVTGVAKGTVNFTFDEDSGDVDVARYPAGMALEEGDKVLVRIDEDEGNLVLKALDE